MQEKVAPSADTGSGNDARPPLARTLIKAILKDAVRIVAVDRLGMCTGTLVLHHEMEPSRY